MGNPFAPRTRHARAHDPVHDEAAGDVFQLLGHILADYQSAPRANVEHEMTMRQAEADLRSIGVDPDAQLEAA